MPETTPPRYTHILIQKKANTELYRTVSGGGGGWNLPQRTRRAHGRKLLQDLKAVDKEAERIAEERADLGLSIVIEGTIGYDLKLESLENKRSGIELLNVRETQHKLTDGTTKEQVLSTVYVPHGKLAHFFNLVDAYLHKETKKGTPRNKDLIDGIEGIRLATVKALWTDEGELPSSGVSIWWEVWLRGSKDLGNEDVVEIFREEARVAHIELSENQLQFPERTVILAFASARALGQTPALLGCIAELRRAKSTAETFTRMSPREQREWVEEALQRIRAADGNAPAVCLLDTGVNNGHPLIKPHLSDSDMDAYNKAWTTADHDRHGTEMAGLALYGDLTDLLASSEPVDLMHRLESVKILPPGGSNKPELYGEITRECVARAEINAPKRQRAVCLTVTTTDFRDRGQPTSWSSAIDQTCSGAGEEGEPRRLIVASCGNTEPAKRSSYPFSNEIEGIHDPGQAWNAVTVGAFTNKISLDTKTRPGWIPLAPAGGLSPSSTTSLIWQGQWPIKPDIVFEGGNMAFEAKSRSTDYEDSLQLLSTHWRPIEKHFVVTGDTSAATALASRMAAIVLARYPLFWPETVRGLVIHSGEWTRTMLNGVDASKLTKNNVRNILRKYGYGVPSLDAALWSANNSLTLIAQDSLQPFFQEESVIKTKDLHLHHLPWPKQVLRDQLGATTVEMRVTLSYFIEPNPSRRSHRNKFRYASHGLRFEVKRPTERIDDFRKRVNKIAREEEEGYQRSESDSTAWRLGADLRSRGSIHSDTWTGTAADLADKGVIAVFPVNGWWKDRKQLEKWNEKARYSLIVTLRTPSTSIDIYTPVANLVKVKV